MTIPIRWGILSTGYIAHQMATTLSKLPDAKLVAVGSRNAHSATSFADQFNIPHRHDNYQALVQNTEVDIVYIGSPHSFHYDHMLLCLAHNKHILCEKPFTLNASQAKQVFELAKQKQCFVMEAMWMVFFPAFLQVQDWLAKGLIGDIQQLQADFCIDVPFDPGHRLYNPQLGGGALLDLGIYPLTLALFLLGKPDTIQTSAIIGKTGVDESNEIHLGFTGGATARLISSSRQDKARQARITGSRGSIVIGVDFFQPTEVILHIDGAAPERLTFPVQINGYEFEVNEVHRCLAEDKLESERMSWARSLEMMQLMDSIRADWGLRYPQETEST